MVEKASKSKAGSRKGGGGFVGWLASTLRGAADALAPSESARPAPPPRQGPTRVASPHSALDQMLKAYLTDRGDSAVSKIHLISMEEVRSVFGADWDRLEKKATMIAEGIIRHHLSPTDFYYRQPDGSFLVMLSGAGVEEAAAKVEGMAGEIRRRLLGDQADNMKSFGVKASAVTLSELLEQGTIPSFENIAKVLDDRLPEEEGVRTFQRRPGADGLSPQARVYESITVRYRPVWNPGNGMVFAYQVQPTRTTDFGNFAGQWALNGGYLDPLGIEVDKKVIHDTVRQLKALEGLKTAPVLMVPLHFKSFTGQARDQMFDLIARLVRQGRQDLIAIELVGLVDSLPVNRLPPILGALGRLARFVAVRAVPDQVDHIGGMLAGASMVGVDLNDISRHGADGATRVRLLADVARFARDQRIASYAWDLKTLDEVKVALEAGYANLGGQAVAAECAEPKRLYDLDIARVVR